MKIAKSDWPKWFLLFWERRDRSKFWNRVFRFNHSIQKKLNKRGISIHDPFRGVCTEDFRCCEKDIGGHKHEHIFRSLAKAAGEGDSHIIIIDPDHKN